MNGTTTTIDRRAAWYKKSHQRLLDEGWHCATCPQCVRVIDRIKRDDFRACRVRFSDQCPAIWRELEMLRSADQEQHEQ